MGAGDQGGEHLTELGPVLAMSGFTLEIGEILETRDQQFQRLI